MGCTTSTAGVGDDKMSCTATDTELIPGEDTVTTPLYVPAEVKPCVFTATTKLEGEVEPELGETPNQGAFFVTDQEMEGVLLMATILDAGLEPPTVLVKLRLVGVTFRVGGSDSQDCKQVAAWKRATNTLLGWEPKL